MLPTPIIQVTGLRKQYGDVLAVEDISFDVARGEVFGIVGPNGAGKTTTVECLAGLRTGDAGSVRVDGIDPWTDRAALTAALGIQLQESQLQPKITVREALELWSALYPDPEPWRELSDRVGLSELHGRRFEKLSGGQQQRLSIALTLIGRPRVVVLDELSTGLDPRARQDVWQVVRDLRDGGTTVVLVTHSMEEAQHLCDRIAVIDSGRVRALDTPEALIRGTAAATATSFEVDTTVDLEALRRIPGVVGVRADGSRIVVEGEDGVAVEVIRLLLAEGTQPRGLRVVDGTLDAAYLDLTSTTGTEH